MKALRLVVFGAVLALFVLFAVNNWTPTLVSLPNGAKILTPLPMIVFVAFLLGWLPVLLLHLAARASWRRRTTKIERLLDDALSNGPRVASSAGMSAAPVTPFPPAS